VRKDLAGQKFGRLTVVKYVGRPPKGKGSVYYCVCECGNSANVLGSSLKTGNTKSCGCIKREQLVLRNFKHGKVKSPIYGIWSVMKDRCNNPKNKSYKNYGGRGIKVCEEWQDFDNFHNDMISAYLKGLTVERVDNNGDYCKGNCIWADMFAQANNKRRNKVITYKGVTDTLTHLSKAFGFDYVVVQGRLYDGWDVDRAIETPKTNYKTYSYNGETMPLIDLCRKYNQEYSRVQKRLEHGWDIEKALLTPKTHK